MLPSTAAASSWRLGTPTVMSFTRGCTAPQAMMSLLTSTFFWPTPASVTSSSSFSASSRLASSPSIFTSGVAMPSSAIWMQRSSLPFTFSSSSCIAASSPACTRRVRSRTEAGARGSAWAAFGFGLAASSAFGSGLRSSLALAAGAGAGARSKRCLRSQSAISDSPAVSFALLLGAPFAASARSSSGQSSGRGVKSTHLPSGMAFHQ
mmetsp:Transcript_88858/g.287762  ORF Transcript_88858/g.287762 Transcript_88858/m.287762 type:complete len:207 (+) Transcript_88858:1424-2044(+)